MAQFFVVVKKKLLSMYFVRFDWQDGSKNYRVIMVKKVSHYKSNCVVCKQIKAIDIFCRIKVNKMAILFTKALFVYKSVLPHELSGVLVNFLPFARLPCDPDFSRHCVFMLSDFIGVKLCVCFSLQKPPVKSSVLSLRRRKAELEGASLCSVRNCLSFAAPPYGENWKLEDCFSFSYI